MRTTTKDDGNAILCVKCWFSSLFCFGMFIWLEATAFAIEFLFCCFCFVIFHILRNWFFRFVFSNKVCDLQNVLSKVARRSKIKWKFFDKTHSGEELVRLKNRMPDHSVRIKAVLLVESLWRSIFTISTNSVQTDYAICDITLITVRLHKPFEGNIRLAFESYC